MASSISVTDLLRSPCQLLRTALGQAGDYCQQRDEIEWLGVSHNVKENLAPACMNRTALHGVPAG